MEPSIRGPITSALTRKSRGPRTRLGKERSKHNARTHGIFAKVVVLESESQAEFDSLRNGFFEDFQPCGRLEETLVELLAVSLWRQRRVLVAEAAEIEAGMEPFTSDEKEGRRIEDGPTWALDYGDGGIVRKIGIPGVLERCLDLLGTLKLRIETNGLDAEKDKDILTKLYGVFDKDQPESDLFTTYSTWPTIAHTHGQLPSAEECKSHFLEELAKEVKTLVRCQEEQKAIESKQMKLESRRRNVPDSPRLEQLIKYSTSIQRTFDRTLIQLERAQRMRLGQPVAPQIDVNISSS
jgi:hypothetical protein